MHLTCYAGGGSKKKKNNPFKLSLLTAKHENNKAYPVILQQAGTEMPLVGSSPPTHVLQSGPIHTAGVTSESLLVLWDAKLWHILVPLSACSPQCVTLCHTKLWAAQPQPELLGASAKAEHVAGVELTPVQPVKTPKLYQGCAAVAQKYQISCTCS